MLKSNMKRLEDRLVSYEIHFAVWSDRMDLLALSNQHGSVFLYRLNWQKVWVLPSKIVGVLVRGIAWRPDGKVIAIAYSNGTLLLIDVETKNELHEMNFDGDISSVIWLNIPQSDKKYTVEDDSNIFLPELPDLSSWSSGGKTNLNSGATGNVNEENAPDANSNINSTDYYCDQKLVDKNLINILLIGTSKAFLHIRIFGIFQCCDLNLNEILQDQIPSLKIISAYFSEDYSNLFVAFETPVRNSNKTTQELNRLKIIQLNSSIFSTHAQKLHAIAFTHGKLISLMKYLDMTLQSMTDTWEFMILQIRQIVTISPISSDQIIEDLFDLFLFGITSSELESLLIHNMTKKGMKKLTHAVSVGFSNVEKLIIRHLLKVGETILYHLSELKGLTRMPHRYEILGLSEKLVDKCIYFINAFLIRVVQFQQIIDKISTRYKVFFRWLYVTILRLMEEPMLAEINKMTQADILFIGHCLKKFSEKNEIKKEDPSLALYDICTADMDTAFLEILGKKELITKIDLNNLRPQEPENKWTNFLQTIEDDLHSTISQIQTNSKESLRYIQACLETSLTLLFESPKQTICDSFTLKEQLVLQEPTLNKYKVSFTNPSKEDTLIAILDLKYNNYMHLIKINQTKQIARFHFNLKKANEVIQMDLNETNYKLIKECQHIRTRIIQNKFINIDGNLQVVDIQFYTTNILSLLLTNEQNQIIFCQLPISQKVFENLKVQNSTMDLDKFEVEMNSDSEDSNLENIRKQVESTLNNGYNEIFNACIRTLNGGLGPIQFAVSGSRKVSAIIFQKRRRIFFYEMENEDEDEEEEVEMESSSVNENKSIDISLES